MCQFKCDDEIPSNHWQCGDGLCIERKLVCDQMQHCHDGSDELSCNLVPCKNLDMKNGPKIPEVFVDINDYGCKKDIYW